MNFLERFYFEQKGGMLREFEALMTYFEPKDIPFYRNLLPAPFALPLQPVVIVFVANYLQVATWGVTHFQYQEWYVVLKSRWNGEESWYPVTMPVSNWLPTVGGRYLGFPKYVADQIALTRGGETRLATARYKGVEQLHMEYCPGLTRPLAPWEKELVENELFFKGNFHFHVLVPPGRGPRAQKVTFRHAIESKWTLDPGMIRLRAHPNESWAGLIPDIDELTGAYCHFIGGANLISEPVV